MVKKTFLFVLLLLCCALLLQAQQPQIKYVSAQPTPAHDGQAMYVNYCASCHGETAQGNGPVAQVIKEPIPNLTTLKARNGGQFPYLMVVQSIKGDPQMPAHGTADMPVWGPVLRQLSQRSEAEMELRVHNLTDYVESMQK
jgi:mono/diheme cytochrome c family protein